MYKKKTRQRKQAVRNGLLFYVLEIIIIQEHWKRKGKDYAERKDSDTCRDRKYRGL